MLYLVSYSHSQPNITTKSRKNRAIIPLAVIIGIAAITITPITIGSVTAGYLISYTLRDKTSEKCRFKIFNTNKINNNADEKLVWVNFPFTLRMEDDRRVLIDLEHFTNEYIFKNAGEMWNKPDLQNMFRRFVITF